MSKVEIVEDEEAVAAVGSTVEARALELFAGGASVNKVASELKIGWLQAKKLRDGGSSPKTRKKRDQKRRKAAPPAEDEAEAEAADEEEEIADWDIPVTVAAARQPAIFAGFSVAEQVAGVQHVLQMRMDAVPETA